MLGKNIVLAVGAFSALLVACSAAPGQTDRGSSSTAVAENDVEPSATLTNRDDVVFRTIVRTAADGTQTVKTVTISRQQAEADARRRTETAAAQVRGEGDKVVPQSQGGAYSVETVQQDTSCDGSDIWLYDGVNTSDPVCPPASSDYMNEICFDGTAGTVTMSNYPRCTGYLCTPFCHCTTWSTWQDAVRAFWPGSDGGYFTQISDYFPANQYFSAWGGCSLASPPGAAYADYSMTLN